MTPLLIDIYIVLQIHALINNSVMSIILLPYLLVKMRESLDWGLYV